MPLSKRDRRKFASGLGDLADEFVKKQQKAAKRAEDIRLTDEEVQDILSSTLRDLSTIQSQQINRLEEEAARDRTIPEEAIAARRRGAETQTAEKLVEAETSLKQTQDVRDFQATQYEDMYAMSQEELAMRREELQMKKEAYEDSQKWQTLGFLSDAVSFIPGVGPALSAGMKFFGNLFQSQGNVGYNPATQTLSPYNPAYVGGIAPGQGGGFGFNPNAPGRSPIQGFNQYNETSDMFSMKPAYRPEDRYMLGIGSKSYGNDFLNFGRK